MKVTFDEDREIWTAAAGLNGADVSIHVFAGCDGSKVVEVAERTLKRIDERWPELQRNIADELHALYNEEWMEPEIGTLDREAFLEKIVLKAVNVLEEEALSLYFSDSDLFAGHDVAIFWDSDGKIYPATLAG